MHKPSAFFLRLASFPVGGISDISSIYDSEKMRMFNAAKSNTCDCTVNQTYAQTLANYYILIIAIRFMHTEWSMLKSIDLSFPEMTSLRSVQYSFLTVTREK